LDLFIAHSANRDAAKTQRDGLEEQILCSVASLHVDIADSPFTVFGRGPLMLRSDHKDRRSIAQCILL